MFSFVPTLMRDPASCAWSGQMRNICLPSVVVTVTVKVLVQAEGGLLRTVTDIFHSYSVFLQNGAERKRSGERSAKPLFGGLMPSRASTLPHCTPAS